MTLMQLFQHLAHPHRISGPIIEAPLPNASIGELCMIRESLDDPKIIGRAQVIGFNHAQTMLSILGSSIGFSKKMVLEPMGERFTIELSAAMLGSVLDSTGLVVERLYDRSDNAAAGLRIEKRWIEGRPPDYSERRGIDLPLETGVRAVDALLTCGHGQRIGIFAAAGCGKTSLMNMLIDHSEADVYVVALIGERGREVTEFIETVRESPKRSKLVVVYSTSDRSSVDRCNAALIATTVAEYFRDNGNQVMLFLDSMTRYARALRDVSLAAGEMPARRGYPASVFENLPKLLERPGKTEHGSITAFYTVLLENEEEPDPIGDEIRSILDGHIYLSKKLASQGHFPAIDVLKSLSRVFPQVTKRDQQNDATAFRNLLSRLEDMQLYLDLGEYHRGENVENDKAIDKKDHINGFLRQRMDEPSRFNTTLEKMHALIA